MAARGAGALRETMTLAQAGDGDGPMCPRAAAIVSGLERQRQEAGRLRGLLQAQTEALLAERGGAAPQPGSEPLDPVSERTAATVSIAKATTEHMLQFVDLAMQKLQAQDDWWRTQLEKAGAQSGGLTEYVTQMADESEELLKAATPTRELEPEPEAGDASTRSRSVSWHDEADEDFHDASEEHATEIVRGVCCRRRGHHRHKLPAPRPDIEVTLWNLLKNLIGQDLTRVTLPVFINEPLTFQQRLAEELEAWPLLDIAAGGTEHLLPEDADWNDAQCLREPADLAQHSVMRLLHAATFAVAGYASTYGRIKKPFNPLLGETYELLECGPSGGGIRHISEQVGHHPPVTAFHCESLRLDESSGDPTFVFSGGVEPKTKFKGTRVDAVPHGLLTVRTAPHGDCFEWRKVNTSLENMIVGTQYLDNWGDLVMRNVSTGDVATITFHKPGLFSGDLALHSVTGTINDRNGNACFKLEGRWCDEVWATPVQPYCDQAMGLKVMKRHLVWRRATPPPWSSSMYDMSAFAYGLNDDVDLTSDQATRIPPTDARRRPDVRELERGDLDKAAEEKVRLEEQQRTARKNRTAAGASAANDHGWTPRWFTLEQENEQNGLDSSPDQAAGRDQGEASTVESDEHGPAAAPDAWRFTNSYWEARAATDFGLDQAPSIF
jgi:hypothetical protein